MASIEKRSDTTYRITVSCGYDSNGKKLRKSKTITLPDSMTNKQREKEVQKQAALFEREVENGTYLDGANITFAEFTQKWLKDYAEKKLAPGTLNPYKSRLEKRIIPAIGHIKLAKLQPLHLLEFYNNLEEADIRLDTRYSATNTLLKLLEKYSTPELVKSTGISFKTCQNIKKGGSTIYETANKLCIAWDVDVKKMFKCNSDKKLSDKTIRHHHGIISSILSTAVKWNLITFNAAERVDWGKMEKYKPAYYDDEQIIAMFEALENEPLHYKTIVYLAIDTGMRAGELTGLTWMDIDLNNGIVDVNKQRQYVSGYGTIVKDPKTGNGIRTITLSDTVTALLQQYRQQQIADMYELGITWRNDNYVFIHEDGTPMHPHRPYKWFTEFLERHGLPKITFHQLRHTNASLLISAGTDIVTLSERLGHGDKNITINTYSHVIKSKEVKAANRMDIFYSQANKKSAKFNQ